MRGESRWKSSWLRKSPTRQGARDSLFDAGSDLRRARFVARFNHGYRSYEATYRTCTPSATEAIRRYVKEGETLSRELANQYGD